MEGQTGVQQGAADQTQDQQQQVQQPAAPQIPEDYQGVAVQNDKGEHLVPLAKALDERGKRQDLEGKIQNLEEQLWLYRMNPVQAQPQPQGQPQGQPQSQPEPQAGTVNLPEFLAKMPDTEMISAGELKQALQGLQMSTPQSGPDSKTWEMVGEQLLTMQHGDAEQVIMGGFRQRVQKEPWLVQAIQNAHPMLRPFMAYRLGKGQSEGQAQSGAQQDLSQQQQISPGQVQQALGNANKPVPTSQVTGSGAFGAADRYANMSDDEIEAEIARVKSGSTIV